MIKRVALLSLACILAPVLACVVGAVVFTLIGGCFDAGCHAQTLMAAALFGALLGVIAGLPALLLIGLPLHVYLQRRGVTAPWPYALGGAVAGVPASVIVAIAMANWQWPILMLSTWLMMFALGAAAGVAAALLFWLMWRLRRPSPNPTTSAP